MTNTNQHILENMSRSSDREGPSAPVEDFREVVELDPADLDEEILA